MDLAAGHRAALRHLGNTPSNNMQSGGDAFRASKKAPGRLIIERGPPHPGLVTRSALAGLWLRPDELSLLLSRNDAVEFSGGAQPPGLQFGAPRAERARSEQVPNGGYNSSASVGREGAAHSARGGRAPHSNCIVPAQGEGITLANSRTANWSMS